MYIGINFYVTYLIHEKINIILILFKFKKKENFDIIYNLKEYIFLVNLKIYLKIIENIFEKNQINVRKIIGRLPTNYLRVTLFFSL